MDPETKILDSDRKRLLRELPSVDELLRSLGPLSVPHLTAVEAVRASLAQARASVLGGSDIPNLQRDVLNRLEALERHSLRSVINATGVILHTNLGRAPLAEFTPHSGYSNLEYDLAEGRRGKRDVHTGGLLWSLLGAPTITVNNNAAAVFLALHELAAGGEVVVSRGELIEIGDGFRIPDIMTRSGAILREVGTTNRTRIDDYRAAITAQTKLLMRVHPSNFQISGFTGKPELAELVALGRERGVPVYEDLGSGCLVDLSAYGIAEPLAQASIRAGVDLVSFSGDKLLGGPQAGILAGREDLVTRLRRNPMYRALRLDKLVLQALEATLRPLAARQYERIPALRMISESADRIRGRAERLAEALPVGSVIVIAGESVIGGGSTPMQTLPTWLLALPQGLGAAHERALRLGEPPVICRVAEGRALLDLRTVSVAEETILAARLMELVGQSGG